MKALRWVRDNKHRAWGFFWIAAIIPTLVWWKDSVLWVALMSLYANAETAFGASHAQEANRSSREAEQTCSCAHQADCTNPSKESTP